MFIVKSTRCKKNSHSVLKKLNVVPSHPYKNVNVLRKFKGTTNNCQAASFYITKEHISGS